MSSFMSTFNMFKVVQKKYPFLEYSRGNVEWCRVSMEGIWTAMRSGNKRGNRRLNPSS